MSPRKTFVIFIGFAEAAALMREMKKEPTERPMTHDLMQSIFLGFDLTIKQIIVTEIVDNAFCATLILEQKITDKNGDWQGRRNEVRIDARPSDCLVLALKNQAGIYVTEEVFEQVQDFSHLAHEDASSGLNLNELGEGIFGTRQPGLEEQDLEEEDEGDEEL